MADKPSDPKQDPTFQKVVQKFLTTKPQPKKVRPKAKKAKKTS